MAKLVSFEDARIKNGPDRTTAGKSNIGRSISGKNGKAAVKSTFFNRNELYQLLNLYSRRVMSGEWRDYAIDHSASHATFSIFRHTAERPEYAITKLASGRKHPQRFVLNAGPRNLKQSQSLDDVISALEKRLRVVWSNN
jgi:Protein of unknown function (DUF2794)